MDTIYSKHRRGLRLIALLLTVLLTFPVLTACGTQTAAPPPPVDDTRGGTVYNPPLPIKPKRGED